MINFKYLVQGLFIFFIVVLIMTGCQNDNPLSAEQKDYRNTHGVFDNQIYSSNDPENLHTLSDDLPMRTLINYNYPQYTSCSVKFFDNWNRYRGSSCQIPNGSFFEFQHGALTPPSEINWGEDVTITMMVEMDTVKRELVYTFGPSGCTFDPPAKVWLDWSDLGSDNATLFYLKNDGTRELQFPDQIDVYNKHMCIYINHFSRYAVAYSNIIKPKDIVYIDR